MNFESFGHRDFRLYTLQRFLAVCSHQMLTVAVGQHVYEVTHNPFHLGYVGLSLFLPKIGFSLLAGHLADRFDRRGMILVCRMIQFSVVTGLILYTLLPSPPGSTILLLYTLLFLMGTANAFEGPSSQSILPHLVPDMHFPNAVTWNATIFQIGLIVGPALGGWIYALTGHVVTVFLVIASLRLVAAFLVKKIGIRTGRLENSELSWKTLLAGVRYVIHKRIILGTISLDLFAVLLGGAVALLPVYANDILKVGPAGLGLLRAAPGLGALLTALAMTHLPPLKRAGLVMIRCVFFFGIAIICFGLSRNFFLSLFCLFISGAVDMVSVVIRGVLVQMETPASMRGRVSAVNIIFIGASNELGEFESGLTAGWFGTVPAVILGGLGTVIVALLWDRQFPEIRRYQPTGLRVTPPEEV